jgi:hypothetical protein
METIAAVFHNEVDARQAYARLQDAGVPGDSIGMVVRDTAGANRVQHEQVHDAGAWVGSGVAGAAGGVAGGAAGWAATLGLAAAGITIPVVGPVLVVGALVGAGAAAGHALGWLAGARTEEAVDHHEAEFFQTALSEGGVVLTVKTHEDQARRVRELLRMCHGREYGSV